MQIRLDNERKVENWMRKWDGDTIARILILIYSRYDGKNDEHTRLMPTLFSPAHLSPLT